MLRLLRLLLFPQIPSRKLGMVPCPQPTSMNIMLFSWTITPHQLIGMRGGELCLRMLYSHPRLTPILAPNSLSMPDLSFLTPVPPSTLLQIPPTSMTLNQSHLDPLKA